MHDIPPIIKLKRKIEKKSILFGKKYKKVEKNSKKVLTYFFIFDNITTEVEKTSTKERRIKLIRYNFDKLKGKIKEVFNTQNEFAEALGIAPNTLSSKLNNQFDFSSNEISRAVDLLNISSPIEAWNIFFTQEVEKTSTK